MWSRKVWWPRVDPYTVTFFGVWLLNLGQHVLYRKPGCSSPQLTPPAGLVTLYSTAIPVLAHTTIFNVSYTNYR